MCVNFNLDYSRNKNTFDTGDHLICCCFISCVDNYLTNHVCYFTVQKYSLFITLIFEAYWRRLRKQRVNR